MTNFMGDVASAMVMLEASSRGLIKYCCIKVQDRYLESVDVIGNSKDRSIAHNIRNCSIATRFLLLSMTFIDTSRSQEVCGNKPSR
jgi:hypothetical protein